MHTAARLRFASILLGGLVLAGMPDDAHAQFGKLKDKVKRKVEQKTDEKTDQAIDGAVDEADPTGGSGSGSADEGAPASSGNGAAAEEPTAAAPAAPAAPAALKPGEGAWANYDFKPGERVLFFDDFTKDEVGDFPRRLELVEGNMEIVEWQGGRYLRGTSFSSFHIPLPETLPERYTLEFDYTGPTGWDFTIEFDGNEYRHDGTYVALTPQGGGLEGKVRSQSEPSRDLTNKVFPVRIMVDGKYAKVYMDDKRVGNAPNADLGRAKRITFHFGASEDAQVLIGPIRVAAGGKKLYDAIAASGRAATQGIYFDTGSDRLRPESSPTLKEIGLMLQEHADLKLLIEGHTDNVGKPEANQALSEKRANAVRQFLIDTYKIDPARLQAKGLGDTKPSAPNTTPEGRQGNRRVELVKI